MTTRRITAALLALTMLFGSAGLARAADPPPVPAPPPGPGGSELPAQFTDVTPARLSYLHGDVSFWRPGAEDWGPARLNTPLAPGDTLYAGQGGNVEIQVGPRAFVRAGDGTQIGLDNQDSDYTQLRVTAGHVALDVRELDPGETLEIATPNGAFTVERPGFYRLDVGQDFATFRTHRGGTATMTPPGGAEVAIGADRQVIVTGTDMPRVEMGAAPELTAWDRWNSERTDALLQISTTTARYVPAGVYGAETLAQHGTWRTVETYGNVWVPSGVAAGWVPYSTGRWIWDPRYGWTWLDEAPWGWAPYHYGRWVYASSYWAWAPGPIIVRPLYAPALVVFLGGNVSLRIGRPIGWAPLGWGEPVIPWWGRPGFHGRPSWGGWGGPRVVNNVVVNRNTTVNVTNINVYRNVHVTNAVVGVPAERFGHTRERPVRFDSTDVRRLTPVQGSVPVRPVAASLAPATGTSARPPEGVRSRPVVATRQPRDVAPALRSEGLSAERAPAAPVRVVPSARNAERGGAPRVAPAPGATAPAAPGRPEQARPEPSRRDEGKDDGRGRDADRPGRQAVPSPAPGQGGTGAPSRERATVTPAPGATAPAVPGASGRPEQARPEPSRRDEGKDDGRGRDADRPGRQVAPLPPSGQNGTPSRERATVAPSPAPAPATPGTPARPEPARETERRARQTPPPTPAPSGESAPQRATPPAPAAPRAAPPQPPQQIEAPRPSAPARPEPPRRDDRQDRDAERRVRQTPPPQPSIQQPAAPPRQPQIAPAQPSIQQPAAPPRQPEVVRPAPAPPRPQAPPSGGDPRATRPAPPQRAPEAQQPPPQQQQQQQGPSDRGDRSRGNDRPDRGDRGDRPGKG